MTENRDVVEHVQIGSAVHINQVIAPAAFNARRVNVIVFLRAGKTGIAAFEQGFRVQLRLGVAGQPEQHRR